MKQWMRVSIPFVLAICAVAAGLVVTPHARADGTPPGIEILEVSCQVYFYDGPNMGNTEPVTFETTRAFTSSGAASSGNLMASANEYINGWSESGSWWLSGSGNSTGNFTFTAQLAVAPGGTLTVTATFPAAATPVAAASVGTIVDSSGTVLVVTHTSTTCPILIPWG